MVTAKNLHEWIFPEKEFFLMKIELVTIAALTVLIFFMGLTGTESWAYALVFALIFVVVYAITSFFIQKARLAKDIYKITDTHLHITRKTRRKEKTHKVPLKDVTKHKLDRFFLGGYLLARGKKHVLFFNNIGELEKFEKILKKGMKK